MQSNSIDRFAMLLKILVIVYSVKIIIAAVSSLNLIDSTKTFIEMILKDDT